MNVAGKVTEIFPIQFRPRRQGIVVRSRRESLPVHSIFICPRGGGYWEYLLARFAEVGNFVSHGFGISNFQVRFCVSIDPPYPFLSSKIRIPFRILEIY